MLERVAAHPNRRYFIFKSIILNNLFGVDIMEEAVEICKLRLFLKLAAQVEPNMTLPNLGIEPLPDIDFNIRAGNTLVGYATYDEVKKAVTSGLDFDNVMGKIETKAKELKKAFDSFRSRQIVGDGSVPMEDKLELRRHLKLLDDELNRHLAGDYNVNPSKKDDYAEWVKSHQPFHWFVEFYGIVHSRSGFDVIIGNPPYLDLKQNEGYTLHNYATLPTNNLYSLVLERCAVLVKGRQGFIVPISSTSTEGYKSLQNVLLKRMTWFTSFDDRPAHLFDGLDKNTLSIILSSDRVKEQSVYASRLNRWNSDERVHLFQRIHLHVTPNCSLPGCLPRIGTKLEFDVWEKIFNKVKVLSYSYVKHGKGTTYYSRKVNSFLQVIDFVPIVRDGRDKLRPPSEFKSLTFYDKKNASVVFCLLNSTLFRWFMDVVSDGSHLNKRELDFFPFNIEDIKAKKELFEVLARNLSKDLKGNSFERKMKYKHDTLTVQCIVPKYSKLIIDKIEFVLAQYYGFTEEELDFIINYDIKYRMGREEEDEESE